MTKMYKEETCMKKLSVLMILGILLVGCSSKPKEEPVSLPETKTETESKTDYSEELNILKLMWEDRLSKKGMEFYEG